MMFSTLLKKQLMEVGAWLLIEKKSGKKRSPAGILMMAVLFILVFFSVGSTFFFIADAMCLPLDSVGFGWLYFSVFGLISVVLGAFGSVFTTGTTLYRAKDNAFLLSLPIPPMYILAVRLIGIWLWSMLYQAIVLIPAMVVYWLRVSPGAITVVLDICLFLLLSLFVVTLSCVLGYGVTKLSGKMKNKSFVTVLISLIFIALYYWGYSKAYGALQSMLAHVELVGAKVKGNAYVLYLLGRMGEGDLFSALIVACGIILLFALVFFLLSRSFIRLSTDGSGAERVKYKEKSVKVRSAESALLFKECKRFTASSVYMLNCGLGTVMLPVGGLVLLFKADWLCESVAAFGVSESMFPLIGCVFLCLAASMNDITAPGISLEGKNLWLAQSLPVSAWQVLKAKLKFHIILTEAPVLFAAVCVYFALRLTVPDLVLMLILSAVFVWFHADFGLMINLKFPILNWTNETVPVKQSIGVMIALLGAWGMVVLLAVLYFSAGRFFSAQGFLCMCIGIVLLAAFLLHRWLKKTGAHIFESL